MAELEMIAFGSYQIEQARCYLSNFLNDNDIDLNIYKFDAADARLHCTSFISAGTDPLLLLMDLKSRFVSQRVHRVFVLLDKNKSGLEAVIEYCCSCKVGNRTVGCCSHVMALLYFVCFAPRNGGIKEVASHLASMFVENNWNDEVEEDEDEESEDE